MCGFVSETFVFVSRSWMNMRSCYVTHALWLRLLGLHIFILFFFFNQIGLIPTRLAFSLSTYSRVGHPATQGSLTLFGRNTLISSCRILCLPQQSVLFFSFLFRCVCMSGFVLRGRSWSFFFLHLFSLFAASLESSPLFLQRSLSFSLLLWSLLFFNIPNS